MKTVEQIAEFDWLIRTYFSEPSRRIRLKKGEILMEQDKLNNRLYLVRSGTLSSYVREADGTKEEIFTAGKNAFVGAYSFFSKSFKSLATVEALTDCELAYIDKNQDPVPKEGTQCLEKQFMPVAVVDLMKRQQRVLEVSREREQALKKLVDNEKYASLGQMAAGIAHELNNSISVIARNSNWLVEQINQRWKDEKEAAIFESGFLRGRFLSSSDVRLRKKELLSNFKLSDDSASLLAQTGITDHQLPSFTKEPDKDARKIYELWEMGAAWNDMIVAAEQSTHVVKSIKDLGAKSTVRNPNLDLNESIKDTLALLRHKLKMITLNLELNDLPPITGNMGEFVQIWTNIIRNACEAMFASEKTDHELTVISRHEKSNISVSIRDNGPGIPKDILPNIFQPNVTTKISGLSFGLGLGLTIVQRIINEYNGTVSVKSSEKGTTFLITIPVGG
ncbi:MAG: ATP-binding protein [Calditrichaceae bacterium]